MYLPLFRAIFLSIEIFPISGSIFKFVPNLTVFDTKNASPFWNCASNKPVQNMAVYMGSDIVGEMGFLDDSEIIFGDGRQVRPYVPWNEPRTCSKQDLTTSVTYSWHDPTNWVNAENNSIISNFVHAQKVPSDTDVAVFAGDSSYLVVINLPIRVGLIQANDYNHSSKSFLQHMRSFEGGLQFQFGPSITAEYVWSDLNLITDALTITSRGCNDNRGCLNSNFDKKTYLDVFVNDKGPACSNSINYSSISRGMKILQCSQLNLDRPESIYTVECINDNRILLTMSEICSHVSCPKFLACEKPVKPVGHCCEVCGFLLNFESNERFLIEKFSIWTRYLKLEMDKCDVALSIMKIGENLLQMVVITENDTRSYDYQALKQFVDLLLVRIQHQIGDGGIVQESIKILGFSENVKNSAATISLCLLIILIVGIFIGYWKRENIRNLFIRERVNLTAFWGSDKASEPQRDDRMLLEFSHETGASSSTLSVISSSNIKSLKTPKLDLVAPKKFKAFFGSKKRCTSSTSGESPLEMRYPKKQLSVIDSAREMSSATTFTNPMFDKNYSLEFDE